MLDNNLILLKAHVTLNYFFWEVVVVLRKEIWN